jgi:DNA-binding transcriptional regulator YiaG
MKTIKKSSIFNDFGFPILLIHAPHIVVDGQEVLKINYEEIAKKLFHALAFKPSKLNGAEVKFIRHHLGITQEKFSELLMVERSTVAKWEGFDLEPTNMDYPTEQVLRINMILKEDGIVPRKKFDELKVVLRKNLKKPIEINCAA